MSDIRITGFCILRTAEISNADVAHKSIVRTAEISDADVAQSSNLRIAESSNTAVTHNSKFLLPLGNADGTADITDLNFCLTSLLLYVF